MVFIVCCGSKSKAKNGYSVRKDEQVAYYVRMGLDKKSVTYSNCTYVIVKGSPNKYYYKANYTISYPNGSSNSLVDYFVWDEDSSSTRTIPSREYDEIYDDISNKTLDGEIGELKK